MQLKQNVVVGVLEDCSWIVVGSKYDSSRIEVG